MATKLSRDMTMADIRQRHPGEYVWVDNPEWVYDPLRDEDIYAVAVWVWENEDQANDEWNTIAKYLIPENGYLKSEEYIYGD